MTIDTLTAYEDMIKSGMEPEQAKAQVRCMFKILTLNATGLATKEDLISISKDIFYMKLMLGGMFALGAFPIIQEYLK